MSTTNTKKGLKTLILTSAVFGGILATTSVHAAHADTIYTVKPGDTLTKIAQDNLGNVNDVNAIVQKNHIADPNLIEVGQELDLTLDGNTNNVNLPKPVVGTSTTGVHMSNTQNTPTVNVPQQNVQSPQAHQNVATSSTTPAGSGSVYEQFIAAGGTPEMWNSIVMPESGGNPNAQNGQYHGLGQTNQSWGHGSVADQTKGMINYANSRYGSISAAVQYRQSHGWW